MIAPTMSLSVMMPIARMNIMIGTWLNCGMVMNSCLSLENCMLTICESDVMGEMDLIWMVCMNPDANLASFLV